MDDASQWRASAVQYGGAGRTVKNGCYSKEPQECLFSFFSSLFDSFFILRSDGVFLSFFFRFLFFKKFSTLCLFSLWFYFAGYVVVVRSIDTVRRMSLCKAVTFWLFICCFQCSEGALDCCCCCFYYCRGIQLLPLFP